jgi:N-ethylmaleimide reductase
MSKSSQLFTPTVLAGHVLPHRVVMAPMTRARSTQPGDIPGAMNARYYAQRASASLIVTEATQVSPQGKGYSFTPGIYSAEQVAGWRLVTQAVHAAGGRIFLQLWHVGRMSHPDFHNGELPVAPSAVPFDGQIWKVNPRTGRGEMVDCPTPRALTTVEIKGVIEDFRRGARNAIDAGFDGVEIHGANGYLIDQFLRDGTNKRIDSYGGSIENRTRFALEVVDAITKVWSKSRVGIRLAPVSPANDIQDSNPTALFGHLAEKLDERGLAYIHIVEGATGGARDNFPFDYVALRSSFRGAYIANNGYDRQMAIRAVERGAADLIAFGRPFIANPDLVERLRVGALLNPVVKETLYGGGEKGYTDYPAMAAA